MKELFTIDPWAVGETQLVPETLTLAETIFNQANGYIGTRGTFEEGLFGAPDSCEGTYINGLFLRQKIHYEESAHAFATHNHKMVQAPDGKAMRLIIDGEPFLPSLPHCISHERQMDFRRAVLKRTSCWKIDLEREIEVKSERLVSLTRAGVMAIRLTITPKFSGELTIESLLDAAYGAAQEKDEDDPRAGHLSITESLQLLEADTKDNQLSFLHQVKGSKQLIGSACRHRCSWADAFIDEKDNSLIASFSSGIEAGKPLVIEKYVAYADGVLSEEGAIQTRLEEQLKDAMQQGFDALTAEQESALKVFWQNADVAIEGDAALEQGIRFNLFQIFQSTGKDGKRAIGAKGLSGPGYDGHYFWDTEIYIIPFYVYTKPEVAKALLQYRIHLLDASRQRAREMSHAKGALYAWRTIGGEECSAFFPAGTAQYHINAAIAYATRQYLYATDDWNFMREGAAEMLLETARIWADIGHFSDVKGGQFCINEVTGPDEYSAMVDNNFYTNAMAQMHLRIAAEVAQHLKANFADDYAALCKTIGLDESEVALWSKAAENMYLPYDETRGINPQDDGFLNKPRWDFEGTPKENYPLLLNYHPLVIYRHQVLKQADVVLAMALLGHQFPAEQRRNNLEFYEPLTTHDSTLSTCIYSIESSRAGKADEAYRFFEETARMDLENRHHNTEYGLHTACMAGSWMSIAMGFAGMEVYDSMLHFAPHLPEKWSGYQFSILFKGQRIGLSVKPDAIEFTLLEGESMQLECYGESISLTSGAPVSITLKPIAEAA